MFVRRGQSTVRLGAGLLLAMTCAAAPAVVLAPPAAGDATPPGTCAELAPSASTDADSYEANSSVTVSGDCFTPYETGTIEIFIQGGPSNQVSEEVKADAAGSVSATFESVAAGEYTAVIKVNGESADTTFTVEDPENPDAGSGGGDDGSDTGDGSDDGSDGDDGSDTGDTPDDGSDTGDTPDDGSDTGDTPDDGSDIGDTPDDGSGSDDGSDTGDGSGGDEEPGDGGGDTDPGGDVDDGTGADDGSDAGTGSDTDTGGDTGTGDHDGAADDADDSTTGGDDTSTGDDQQTDDSQQGASPQPTAGSEQDDDEDSPAPSAAERPDAPSQKPDSSTPTDPGPATEDFPAATPERTAEQKEAAALAVLMTSLFAHGVSDGEVGLSPAEADAESPVEDDASGQDDASGGNGAREDGGASEDGVDALADTGADVTVPAALAGFALIGGAGLLWHQRRRRD